MNSINRHLRLMMVAAFFVGLTLAPAAASVYISGRVTVGATHVPVPDATVSLFRRGQSTLLQVARTLQNGSFVLQAPGAGSYRLETEGHTQLPTEQFVEVPRTGVTGLEISVILIPVLRVRLLDPQQKPVTGEQVRGWMVVTSDNTEGGVHTHLSQGNGFTKISGPDGIVEYAAPYGLSPGEATKIIVGARDASTGCGQLRLDKWPDTPITLQLERGVALFGRVFDRAGKPAAGVRVQVQPQMPPMLPVTPPTVLNLAEPMDAATAHHFTTGIIRPVVEEDTAMQEGSPCFYQGSVRTITDKDGHFEIPFLFSGCHVMVTFAVPGEGLKYQNVTLGGERMELRLGSEELFSLPQPCQIDIRLAVGIPDCY